jgi:drug/metabolite transporter (DMT)-like permease
LQQQSKIWIILIALWIINGSSFLAIKVAIDTIPPLLSAGLRFSIAGLILLTLFYVRRHHHYEKITREQWKHALVLGAALFIGGQGLLTWGTQYLDSGMTGLLNSTIPLWIAIISFLLYRQHMSKSIILGLIAGFGGLMLLIGPSLGAGTLNPIGVTALIISSVAWAVGSIYSAKIQLPVSIFASSGMIMLAGGLMLFVGSIALGEYRDLDFMQFSGPSLVAQIYLIAIITVVGFTDFYWLLRVTTASLANTFAYVSPVIAVLLGWLLLHESITILTIIAMIVILAGVALMVTTPRKRKDKQIQK